jgi:hypothetical protein
MWTDCLLGWRSSGIAILDNETLVLAGVFIPKTLKMPATKGVSAHLSTDSDVKDDVKCKLFYGK